MKESSIPDLLKPFYISNLLFILLSETIIRIHAVDQEELKPNWKSEKRRHILRQSTNLLFTNFSNTLLTTERRLRGQQFLVVDLSPTFLNTVTVDETFKQSRIQLRFVMTFLTIVGVTEICSFRLVLEGKAVKEIPESARLEF